MSTTERSAVDVTCVTPIVPTGENEAQWRAQELASRDDDWRSAGRYGYVLRTTAAIPVDDYVMIVDTLSREEVGQ